MSIRKKVVDFLCITGFLCISAFASPVSAETAYWRLSTERMTVIANSSAKRCTMLANQFYAYESILKSLANLDMDSSFPPLAVYLLSDSDARKVFLSEEDKQQQSANRMQIHSKFLPGREVNVAAIVDVVGGDDSALQSMLLLYGQAMLSSGSIHTYPAWYQIGIANITNGLMIRADGSALLNRNTQFDPIVDKDKTIKIHYPLEKLLDTTARELTSGGDPKEFYRRARDWALFGLLTTSQRKQQFRELAVLMRQGVPASEAVSQAFNVPLEQLSNEFDEGKWRKQVDFKIAPTDTPAAFPAPERVDPEKAKELLALISERVAQFSNLRR